MKMSRREALQGAAGALLISLPGLGQTGMRTMPVTAWITIREDHTVLLRTGRTETGTGMTAMYCQMLGDELGVRPETISLVMGDTDRTPDGGYSAGFLTGAKNVRKAAAYAREGLRSLAASAWGCEAREVRVTGDGALTGPGGKRARYGDLVRGAEFQLEIPVTGEPARVQAGANGWGVKGLDGFTVAGDPPLKTMAEYRLVGQSYPMPGTPAKVTGETEWSCDVRLPGMLYGQMVRPPTLGASLLETGRLDAVRYPTAKVVRLENLLGVVAEDEWEAVLAARSLASSTRWSEWSGLPKDVNRSLRDRDWGTPNAARGTAAGAYPITASYEQGYVRHAPMGPFVATAEVRKDGSATVWSGAAHLQGMRAHLAHMLGVPLEQVVVRWLPHAGQYGRTTHAGDGAEADAVILSKLTGRPVRVQWTLQEDLAWSSVSPAWFANVRGRLSAEGKLEAVDTEFYSPHMFDARQLGAVLGGMPTTTSKPQNWLAVEWCYDVIGQRRERVWGMPNVAAESVSGGLRGNILRTPGERQQNFAVECLVNEAAAKAGADAIAFRKRHTTEPRLLELMEAAAKEAEWTPRAAPNPAADGVGQGICVMLRDNAYWVGIAKVQVDAKTGVVRIERFTIAADVGKVINPRQLERCMKGGLVMGISEALKEEVTMDSGRVTSTDWNRYKILTMAEMPDEIRVVQISREDKGFGVGGEAGNAVAPGAIAAAIFDATGRFPRRLPMTPAYVRSLLGAG